MRNYLKYLIVSVILFSGYNQFKAQDVIDSLIAWPLDQNNGNSYTYFLYDTAEVDTSVYIKGTGLTSGPLDANGGQWSNVPAGYIEAIDYFEVSFTAKSIGSEKLIEITDLEFEAANSNPFNKVGNLYVGYSFNNDFSDSTILYNYPDGDILSSVFPTTTAFQVDFSTPIVVESGVTIYFRIYPYNGTGFFHKLLLIKNTFLINGIVRNQSSVDPVLNFQFTRGCVSLGELSWDLPSGFNNATDTVVIFAKKTSLIDQGSPFFDPNEDYGTPDSSLAVLDATVPDSLKYENDALAALVYRGVGTSVPLTNFENGTDYSFATFVVDGSQVYSNAKLANGASPNELSDVTDASGYPAPLMSTISWSVSSGCADSVMAVCHTSETAYDPATNLIASYTANADFSATDSYFNGTDDTDGKVVYTGDFGDGNSVLISNLSNNTIYYITIWTQHEGAWSPGVLVKTFPNDYEVIITQTQSQVFDFVEFLTLTEVDFSSEDYNMASYSVCDNGNFDVSNGLATGISFFAALDTVPSGTFIRVYSTSGTNEINSDDGMVSLYSGIALNELGGDQVMIFKGNEQSTDCNTGSVNNFTAGFNYGNAGWLTAGSGVAIDATTSYAPPSVSNLEMPATNTPNFSLKDQNSISGTIETIHDGVSDISTNWSTGNGFSPAIKLKDILFQESDISDSLNLSAPSGDLIINFDSLRVLSDSVDVRYLVVVNDGSAPSVPADRYTCFVADTNYLAADAVVSSVAEQISLQDPCGTPTLGTGVIVYFGKETADITVSNLPCGGHAYVTVYAVKGNGYTANIGAGVSADIVLPDAETTYYSMHSGSVNDSIWALTPTGTDSIPLTEAIMYCNNLTIQSGDTVTFDEAKVIGDLTIDNGGKIAFVDAVNLTITKDLTANDSLQVKTTSRITMLGFRQTNTISGTGFIEFHELGINNSFVTDSKVIISSDTRIMEGIIMTSGNLEVSTGKTIKLVSEAANSAAYLGEIPSAYAVTGDFIVERFLPDIPTSAPSGSGNGVGWRYTTSTVQGSTYEGYADDFTITGITNSLAPQYSSSVFSNWPSTGFYWMSLQKYEESIGGDMIVGFDGDQIGVAPAGLRNRRDIIEPIAAGEGIFSYLGPVPLTYDFTGVPNQGEVIVSLSYTDNGDAVTENGWHLLANPYPCEIDLTQISISSDIGSSVYIYNAETAQFIVRSFDGPLGQVAAGQAFWIKCDAASQITFTESAKREASNATFYKNGQDSLYDGLLVNMVMDSDTNYQDNTVIWVNDDATSGFDLEYDAYKLYSLEPDVSGIATFIDSIYSNISINAIHTPISGVDIPVKVNIRQAGNYTLNFQYLNSVLENSCLTFTDLALDSSFVIEANGSYTFYSELRAEDAAPLFTIHISVPVSIESTDATCYEAFDGTAVAEGVGDGPFTYTWLNANNEEIYTETTNGASILDSLAYGFYSVTIDGNATDCPSVMSEFMVLQPAAYENSIAFENPTCNALNGEFAIDLDTSTTWDISWLNTTNLQNGSALGQTGLYVIFNMSAGDWVITATSECGPVVYEIYLDDNNPVVADFDLPADTVYLVDGTVTVDFTNTSLSAEYFQWLYSFEQEEPDSAVNGSYTYTSPGVYGVSLFAESEEGCYDFVTYEFVVVGSALSVDEIDNGVVRSYISYNGGVTQYVLELAEANEVQVQLVNTMGQVLSVQEIQVNGKTYIDIPTYDLSGGIYLIITLADGTQIDMQKLFVR